MKLKKYPEWGIIPENSPVFNNLIQRYNGLEVDNRKVPKIEKGREQVSPQPPKPKPKPKPPEIHIEGRFTADQLISIGKQETPFLIERLLPHKVIGLLVGESDVGKSLFYLNLALAIVSGKDDFVGLKINPVHRRVLIVSTEDDENAVGRRIIKQLAGEELSPKAQKSLVVYTDKREIYKKLEVELKTHKYDLLVIDSFSDFFEGDLKSSSSVRQFLEKFKAMIIDHGLTVLVVHHLGKTANRSIKNRILGSVGIEGLSRNVFSLEKPGQMAHLRKLMVIKGNYVSESEKNSPMILAFNEDTLTYSVSDEEISTVIESQEKQKPGRKGDPVRNAKIMKLASEGMKQEDIAKEVGLHKSSVCRIIKQNTIKFNTGDLGPER